MNRSHRLNNVMISSEQPVSERLTKQSKIHVVGVTGVEGVAVVSFLLSEGYTNLVGHALCTPESFEKTVLKAHDLDDRQEKKRVLDRVRSWTFPIHFQESYLKEIDQADLIFAPQSWRLYGRENGILFRYEDRLYNAIHLYLELAPCRTIGVTGSDGKTTTAHLIQHLLSSAGHSAWLSGNYRHGTHVLEDIRQLDPKGFLVLEISNRHLNFGLTKYPDVAVVTNVTQNHINEYHHFREYIDIKERILGPETVAVLNADNPFTVNMGDDCKTRYFFSRIRKQDMSGAILVGKDIMMQGEVQATCEDITLPGEHNIENVLAAVTAVIHLGLTPKEIRSGLRSFHPVRERLEFMMTIDGRDVINDLAATGAESTRRGLMAFLGRSISVVLGGDTKEVDYGPLATTIKEMGVRVFGIESEVTHELRTHDVPMQTFPTAQEAMESAYENTPQGGVVIVSPAGAFFSSRYLSGGLEPIILSLQSKRLPEVQER